MLNRSNRRNGTATLRGVARETSGDAVNRQAKDLTVIRVTVEELDALHPSQRKEAIRAIAYLHDAKRGELPDNGICPWCRLPARDKVLPGLTRRQRDILDFLAAYRDENGIAPSFEEIAAAFGFRSLATVHEHITNLERKRYIARPDKWAARNIQIMATL